jgi:hypothetical protein
MNSCINFEHNEGVKIIMIHNDLNVMKVFHVNKAIDKWVLMS